MGLLRDAIGSVMGAGQVNNGFNGPSLPFMNKMKNNDLGTRNRTPIGNQQYQDTTRYRRSSSLYHPSPSEDPDRIYWDRDLTQDDLYDASYDMHSRTATPSPPYSTRRDDPYGQPGNYAYTVQEATPQYYAARADPGMKCFRPLILPQVAYGSGQPFFRGYSDDLRTYGLREAEFIAIVDAINVAIVPNPENQIFQKGASIAGWFVPGAASIGLVAGQIGAGLGVAYGHASSISSILSKANMEVFLPRGLELCICTSKDVNAEVGCYPNPNEPGDDGSASADQRIGVYGNLVAPLTHVSPPLNQIGRKDPIAVFARGLTDRTTGKTLSKAQKDAAGGKNKKLDALESDRKWLMVRQASPEALANLQRNNSSMQRR